MHHLMFGINFQIHFFSLVSHMSRLTSSFTCQPILVIIATLSIHHDFTLSLKAQNLPFQKILPTLTFLLYSFDCVQDNGT